jgi:hypothetical protein
VTLRVAVALLLELFLCGVLDGIKGHGWNEFEGER